MQGDRLASQACGSGMRPDPAIMQSISEAAAPRRREPTYGATIKDFVIALWEASDPVSAKLLFVMLPTLLPALETHGRLKLDKPERAQVLTVSAATIDRMLVETKIEATGAGDGASAFTPPYAARCRSRPSTTGRIPRPASAKSTCWPTAAHRSPARSS